VIELKRSIGQRYSLKGNASKVTVDHYCAPDNADRIGVTLLFDTGTSDKRDHMEVNIDADDFAPLFKEMIDYNFLDAVAQALLAHPDAAPNNVALTALTRLA